MRRATLERMVELPPALGVISRRPVRVALHPADSGSGIRFRNEETGAELPADPEHLAPARNCTALGGAQIEVAFIEHLMACLSAARLSDVLVVTDGPEIPLYDGSASLIWAALQGGGRAESDVAWPVLTVTQPVEVGEGEALLQATPGEGLVLSYELEHAHPLIGREVATYSGDEDFGAALAPARTFATADEIRALYGMDPTPQIEQMCLVVYDDRLSQAPPLPQPFARHKLLDLLGDLFLCGRVVQGHIHARRSGHGLNQALARALRAQMDGGES